MRSSWTKCHKRDSSCASYQDHARRRIHFQASRYIHPGYNLIPIVFKLTRTSYFQTTWWLQHLPARCAMTRGALEHRQSQMWQKRFQQHHILFAKTHRRMYSNRAGSLSTMLGLRLVLGLDERQGQVLRLHHWSAGGQPLYSHELLWI